MRILNFILPSLLAALATTNPLNPYPNVQLDSPTFVDTRLPPALTLYDKDGNKVVYCTTRKDERLSGCVVEPGYTFDDVMNAWLHAYYNKLEN